MFAVCTSQATGLLHLYGGCITSPPGTTKHYAHIKCTGLKVPVKEWGTLPGNDEILRQANGVCARCLERAQEEFAWKLSGLAKLSSKAEEPRK